MNPQEQQVIESLFWRVQQGASQAGPRDPEADALIQQKLQSFPQAPYYLAQALIVQERALQQAEQRINQLQQQAGRGSHAGPAAGYQPAPPPYQPQYAPQPGSRAGGFLAGAGQMALGIGGGILVADAAT
ncbi:MAG: DUF2076 family protein, partial [Candidatus Dormibacteraeota bacterium]|nr:DUF2076 family protein [Candidatus Dormibacteraeota bacterium]